MGSSAQYYLTASCLTAWQNGRHCSRSTVQIRKSLYDSCSQPCASETGRPFVYSVSALLEHGYMTLRGASPGRHLRTTDSLLLPDAASSISFGKAPTSSLVTCSGRVCPAHVKSCMCTCEHICSSDAILSEAIQACFIARLGCALSSCRHVAYDTSSRQINVSLSHCRIGSIFCCIQCVILGIHPHTVP